MLRNCDSISLSDCNIGNNEVAALATALKDNITLKSLNLSHNQIGEDGANALAEMLRHNGAIESLDLMFNNINTDGVRAILGSLENNKTLKTLNLLDTGANKLKNIEFLLMKTSITSIGLNKFNDILKLNRSKCTSMKLPSKYNNVKVYEYTLDEEVCDNQEQDVALSAENPWWYDVLCI